MGFPDFSNFDGVRFAFRGIPVVVFKLKTAINVDELYPIQEFEFQRKSTRQGRNHVDVIGCKIKGLREPTTLDTTISSTTQGPHYSLDDGTREVENLWLRI